MSDAQFRGAVVAPSGPLCRGGGDELLAAENNLISTQFSGTVAAPSVLICRAGSVGAGKGDARHLSRGALVAKRQRQGRRPASGFGAGTGQQARCER